MYAQYMTYMYTRIHVHVHVRVCKWATPVQVNVQVFHTRVTHASHTLSLDAYYNCQLAAPNNANWEKHLKIEEQLYMYTQ